MKTFPTTITLNESTPSAVSKAGRPIFDLGRIELGEGFTAFVKVYGPNGEAIVTNAAPAKEVRVKESKPSVPQQKPSNAPSAEDRMAKLEAALAAIASKLG